MGTAGEPGFWAALQELVDQGTIVIDRPAGSAHPRFPEMVYPLDYGFLEGTTGGDGDGIDCWWPGGDRTVVGVYVTVDVLRSDAEVKVLVGCTPAEIALLQAWYAGQPLAATLVLRDTAATGLTPRPYPILEFDPAVQAVIEPSLGYEGALPARLAYAFLGDEVDRYASDNGFVAADWFLTITKSFPVYVGEYEGVDVCLVQAPLGAPAAVQLLEYLIGHGVREVVAVGSCGTLHDIPENAWLVPTTALRDEGTSYHYQPPARWIDLDPAVVQAITGVLEERGLPYERVATWTTDAFYHETAGLVGARRAEGCTVVEMECAGLAACCAFRGVRFGQLLYTADTLANPADWSARDWGRASVSPGLDLALAAVTRL